MSKVMIEMEMPKGCAECIFVSLGRCVFDSDIDTYFHTEGYLRKDRPFECPLEEVKER